MIDKQRMRDRDLRKVEDCKFALSAIAGIQETAKNKPDLIRVWMLCRDESRRLQVRLKMLEKRYNMRHVATPPAATEPGDGSGTEA